jgi:transcriptional regulator with XRE-family HTH domain
MRRDELESRLGERLRSIRIARRFTQAELAERANVSLGALKHLETGAGASTATLTKVVRALGQERWIENLGATPTFNPLELLEERERERRRSAGRVRPRKGERSEGSAH